MTESGGLAVMSPCGAYRYRLERWWGDNPLTIVMLNPSTADARVDDPTIRRCVSFARREGFGGIVVVNLYALRATDPDELLLASDPLGSENHSHLRNALRDAAGFPVLCAWGANAKPAECAWFIATAESEGSNLVSLGVTKDGHPRHPLYVKGDQPFEPFPPLA